MTNKSKELEIIIRKKQRLLEVYEAGEVIKTCRVVLGFAPSGDKKVAGDGKTPEGDFYIFTKNSESKFHLSLGISYPSKKDAERGLDAGVITQPEHDAIVSAIDNQEKPPQNTLLGGEIYIHGGGAGRDWTEGCVAIKNEEIEELFELVLVGTKVRILP